MEEDDMAEAVCLSQMAATRGRAGQRKAKFLEYRMMQDSPGSSQPGDMEERRWIPVPKGYRPGAMQPGLGPRGMEQGYIRQDEPRIQSSAEPEAHNPLTYPQDLGAKHGKGAPHHPGTRRLNYEEVPHASSPALLSGKILLAEMPKPDNWEKHLRSTKHLQRRSTPRWKEPPVDTEQEKTAVGVVKSQSLGMGPTRFKSIKGRESPDKIRCITVPQTEGLWMPPGAAHGQNLVRQQAIESARPKWRHGINKFNTTTEEEQDPISIGAFKDKSTPGQEPSGSARGNPTIQPACIKGTNRRKNPDPGKTVKRDSNGPPPQGAPRN